MIAIATRVILGEKIKPIDKSALDLDYVGVKAAQFSFARLKGVDPVLGVEMASTGEVGCLGHELNEAFLKAMLSTNLVIPRKNIFFSAASIENKVDFLEGGRRLSKLGYQLFVPTDIAELFSKNGIKTKTIFLPQAKKKANIIDYIKNKKIELVINIPQNNSRGESHDDYLIRRAAVDFDVPLITDLKIALQTAEALEYYRQHGLEILAWDEY